MNSKTAKLYVVGKEPGDEQLVTSIELPHFIKPPEVLLWGSRVFVRYGEATPKVDLYREVFAYAVY